MTSWLRKILPSWRKMRIRNKQAFPHADGVGAEQLRQFGGVLFSG